MRQVARAALLSAQQRVAYIYAIIIITIGQQQQLLQIAMFVMAVLLNIELDYLVMCVVIVFGFASVVSTCLRPLQMDSNWPSNSNNKN